ncbi:MAG TPA: cytochrome c maturation protein CcmE [Longimicrobiales bacterium]
MKTRGLVYGIGSVAVVGGLAYLLFGGLSSNIVYFLTPGELVAKGATAVDASVRLGGQVKPGTVQWNAQKIDLHFIMTDGKQEVAVHSTKAPPQMFRDGQGVVVEGRLGKEGVFEATSLMVKHSNEYKPPQGHVDVRKMEKSVLLDDGGAQ